MRYDLTLKDVIDDIKKRIDATNEYAYTFYNRCYGGGPFVNNDLGLATYNRISGRNFESMYDAEVMTDEIDFFVNVSLVLLEIGCEKAQNEYSSFGLVRIIKRYEECVRLREYDGMEAPWVMSSMVLKKRIADHFQNAPDRILKESDYNAMLQNDDDKLQYIDLPK